ncbi:MAG: DNA polymerase III subunit delta' [Bacteroidales bacterium]|nr:DNA polymerase III subunit delta' [Bacteroidales bacterium]
MLFSQIIGHEDIKKKLIQSVKDNRVAHAQLFLGPEGTGKLALAIAYAQYINCTDKKENDSCGVCPSCKKYNSLAHPDLHFLFPTTTTKSVKKDQESELFMTEWRDYLIASKTYVDLHSWYSFLDVENKQGMINVRDASSIIRKLNLKTYEAEYKVAIIWMAEKFNIQTANKLLKLLEEPPEKTVFILISENQEELLTTVRSRTVLVKIPKLSVDEVQNALIREFQCDITKAYNTALLANGNWIQARNIISDDENNDNIYFRLFQKWMRYCFRFSASELIDFIANDIKPLVREKQKEFLAYGLNVFHNALLYNNGLKDSILLPEEEKNFLINFAPFISNNNIDLIIELFEESINQIERNGNASLIFLDDSFKIFNYFKMK